MKKFLLVLLLCLMILPLISAVSPFKTASTSGCEIAPIIREDMQLGQSFDFNFHVFNTSNGYPLSNASLSCNLHLYNQTGDHIYGANIPNDPCSEHGVFNEFTYRAPSTTFATIGNYAYLIQCNGTTLVGGCADKGAFLVTTSGENLGDNRIIYFTLLFLIILGGFTYVFMTSLGHGVNLDFDVKDLSINLGMYFMLIAYGFLETTYLMNPIITNLVNILISVGVWTNCVLPFLYFILTLTVGSWIKKRVKGVDY